MRGEKITQQSNKWEIKNSLYIMLPLIWAGYAAFFYIGRKSKQKKWIIAGILYFFFCFIPFAGLCWFSEHNSANPLLDISILSLMAYWVVSLIHLIKIRKEYLLRLEAIEITKKDSLSQMKAKIRSEYQIPAEKANVYEDVLVKDKFCPNCKTKINGCKFCPTCGNEVFPSISKHVESLEINYNSQSSKLIDINSCSTEDLEKLPGISTSLAKKAIMYRDEHGFYNNPDEFFNLLNLKPHFTVQIRDIIVCSNNQSGKKIDRKLDF